jgi:pyruvate/2-oxoglutarate dehydrogenase complex dihydrolipoamide acyltransferase (E2) component
MATRKSLSKRLRFEIFKRDGFRCIYCGATPMQKALHVDHVVAVADGGGDTPENLVTACADCNLGKGAVPLERKKLATPVATEADEDHADQIREYLRLQREIQGARKEAVNAIADYWEERIGGMTVAMYDRLLQLIAEWPYQKLIEAIDITARKLGTPGQEFDGRGAENQARYFHGILRKWRTQGQPDAAPTSPAAEPAPAPDAAEPGPAEPANEADFSPEEEKSIDAWLQQNARGLAFERDWDEAIEYDRQFGHRHLRLRRYIASGDPGHVASIKADWYRDGMIIDGRQRPFDGDDDHDEEADPDVQDDEGDS